MENDLRVGLVAGKSSETLVKELQSRGIQVFLICGKETDPGYAVADGSLALYFNLQNTEEQTQKACDYLMSQKIDAFILGTGTWFAFEIAKVLEGKGVNVSHSLKWATIFKEKHGTKELFKEHNLNTLDWSFITQKEDFKTDQIEYPKVMKSNIDLFPVFLCHDKERANKLLEETSDDIFQKGVMVESFADGNDITVPVAVTKDEVKPLGVIYWSKQKKLPIRRF